MKSTLFLTELFIIGLTNFVFFLLLNTEVLKWFNQTFKDTNQTALLLGVLAMAYVVGFLVSSIAELVFSPLRTKGEQYWLSKHAGPTPSLDSQRYHLYSFSKTQVIQRLDYHRSFIRLSRALGLSSFLFMLFSIQKSPHFFFLFLSLFLVSIFSYWRRIHWLTKTTYLSWLATKNDALSSLSADGGNDKSDPSTTQPLSTKKFIVFAGGTGFREINFDLVKLTSNVTRIVPVCDNGGSSESLRKEFNVLPVGDIRHALITMAPHYGEMRKIIKICNWRLPNETNSEILQKELDQIIKGDHFLTEEIEPRVKAIIGAYLLQFKDKLSDNFSLKNGSIGNFILIGAYLAHSNDMNSAIFAFSKICNIQGKVLPVSLEPFCHLGAKIKTKLILGQAQITNMTRENNRDPIDHVFITNDIRAHVEPKPRVIVQPNPLVIEEIASTEIIVYGPGSFYTSIIPHFLTDDIAEKIADREEIPKILIANLTESEETIGKTVADLLTDLSEVINLTTRKKRPLGRYITHILIGKEPHDKFVYGEKNKTYLQHGDLEKFKSEGVTVISRDLEDPWKRGYYDANLVSKLLMNISKYL